MHESLRNLTAKYIKGTDSNDLSIKLVDDLYDMLFDEKIIDSVIQKDLSFLDRQGTDSSDDDIHICLRDPKHIKSIDITYDDSGKIIPLSKRFDLKSDDIRY